MQELEWRPVNGPSGWVELPPNVFDVSGLDMSWGMGLDLKVGRWVLGLKVRQRRRTEEDGRINQRFDYWNQVRRGWMPLPHFATDDNRALHEVIPALRAAGMTVTLVAHDEEPRGFWFAEVYLAMRPVGKGSGQLAHAVATAAVEALDHPLVYNRFPLVIQSTGRKETRQ